MSDLFGDITSSAIYQAMQGLSTEQKAIANNISNLNTPNYKAENVSFESSLAQAIAAGNPSGAAVTTSLSSDPAQQDGNNVNLSNELVEGQKANMQFQTMVAAMNAKFTLLGTAISGSPTGA